MGFPWIPSFSDPKYPDYLLEDLLKVKDFHKHFLLSIPVNVLPGKKEFDLLFRLRDRLRQFL